MVPAAPVSATSRVPTSWPKSSWPWHHISSFTVLEIAKAAGEEEATKNSSMDADKITTDAVHAVFTFSIHKLLSNFVFNTTSYLRYVSANRRIREANLCTVIIFHFSFFFCVDLDHHTCSEKLCECEPWALTLSFSYKDFKNRFTI